MAMPYLAAAAGPELHITRENEASAWMKPTFSAAVQPPPPPLAELAFQHGTGVLVGALALTGRASSCAALAATRARPLS